MLKEKKEIIFVSLSESIVNCPGSALWSSQTL